MHGRPPVYVYVLGNVVKIKMYLKLKMIENSPSKF